MIPGSTSLSNSMNDIRRICKNTDFILTLYKFSIFKISSKFNHTHIYPKKWTDFFAFVFLCINTNFFQDWLRQHQLSLSLPCHSSNVVQSEKKLFVTVTEKSHYGLTHHTPTHLVCWNKSTMKWVHLMNLSASRIILDSRYSTFLIRLYAFWFRVKLVLITCILFMLNMIF